MNGELIYDMETNRLDILEDDGTRYLYRTIGTCFVFPLYV